MKNQFLFLILTFVFCTSSFAQFSSSSTVYIYEYAYTENDGIQSTGGSEGQNIYFVNIQNNVLATLSDRKDRVMKKIMENGNYFENKVINKVAESYSTYKNPGTPTVLTETRWLYLYDDYYSTANKYTYRYYSTVAIMQSGGTGWMGCPMPPVLTWRKWSYGSSCFSFSNDRSEMIRWSTDDPGHRTYYKRINKSDLKTNLDFLNE